MSQHDDRPPSFENAGTEQAIENGLQIGMVCCDAAFRSGLTFTGTRCEPFEGTQLPPEMKQAMAGKDVGDGRGCRNIGQPSRPKLVRYFAASPQWVRGPRG